jgi:hypothetical protein
MAGRILTLQRQVRELGRLRAGYTETGTTKDGKTYERPTSSKTWILTSANRDYLDAAAQLWGGDVLEWQPVGNGPKAWRLITSTPLIDAILPPGDPLSQYQEMWSRGGCQRRCDGEQEMLSGEPCLCRAQHGDDFHVEKQGTVCDIHTRLNVFLPDLPDIGVWRVETKGFWPANHIAGYVDMIKGHVGPQVLVPIRLRIEPRTKIKEGKTSQYIEIVVELRSQATFSQILEAPQVIAIGPADNRTIEAGPARQAIGAAPGNAAQSAALEPDDAQPSDEAGAEVVDWPAEFGRATSMDQLRAMWSACGVAGALTPANKAAWVARGREIRGNSPAVEAVVPAAEPVAADVEPDRDAAWTKVLTLAGARGWSTGQTSRLMRETVGRDPASADGWAFAQFASAIEAGQVAA